MNECDPYFIHLSPIWSFLQLTPQSYEIKINFKKIFPQRKFSELSMKYSRQKSQNQGQWYAIALIIISSSIYHCAHDQFQPLMKSIIEHYDLDLKTFNLLSGFSDLPSIFLPFYLSKFVAKFRPENLLLLSVCTISAGLFAIAISSLEKSIPVLVIGRLALGSFREFSMVALQILLKRRLSLFQFAMAMSFQPTISVVIRIFNVCLVPKILLQTESLTATLFIYWAISQISIVSALYYLLISVSEDYDDESTIEFLTEGSKETKNNGKVSVVLLFFIQMLQAGCYKSFTHIASDLIQSTFRLSFSSTNKMLFIHYASFGIFSPLMALLCLLFAIEKEIFISSTAFFASGLAINLWSSNTNAITVMILYSLFWSMRNTTIYTFVSESSLSNPSLRGYTLSSAAEALGAMTIPLIVSCFSGVDLHSQYTYTNYLSTLLLITLLTLLLVAFWVARYAPKQKKD